ncbi:class I SAM-dependent methyltransferase [Patescibacteria group bacterium]|nr:class I SAM-dependent methyltransferase [Patescibacteria group bacterium]
MLNDFVRKNIKFFSQEVQNFKDYWRADEEYVVNKFFEGKKTLVLGCGAGRTLLPLYKKGFEVIGIDITKEMVVAARQKLQNYPIEILEMDACNLKFGDNTFDNIFFPFHGIDYVHPDIYRAVAEAKRVMKSNGAFVFNSHNRFSLKVLHRFFEGNYADYGGLITYRTTPLDLWRLKKYFKKVKMIQRISIMVDWKSANWKDICYKLVPFLNKSTYFICLGKK